MRHCTGTPQLFATLFLLFLTVSGYAAPFQNAASLIFPQEMSQITAPQDSLKPDADSVAVKTDSLPPVPPPFPVIFRTPLYSSSEFITYGQIDKSNILSFAEIPALYPLSFSLSFGSPVYREHISLYGSYPGENGYLSNGIEMNNNTFSGYDQEILLTEEIDSVEIIPAPRSFLYTINNSLAAFNIIRKERISPLSQTKIKYYEGPFGRAMLDARYNRLIYSRINITVDIMNRKTDDRFSNSSGSVWSGRAGADYYFSENFNAGISYLKTKTDVNHYGGVNADTVYAISSSPEEVIYDELNAPVQDEYLYDKVSTDEITLSMTAKQAGILTHRLAYSSRSYLREYRDDFNANATFLYMDHQEKRNSLSLQSSADLSPVSVDIAYRYEDRSSNTPSYIDPFDTVHFTQSLLPNEASHQFQMQAGITIAGAKAGVFYKSALGESPDYSGYGADIAFRFNKIELYAGYADFRRFYNYAPGNLTSGSQTVTQIRAAYKGETGHVALHGFYSTNTWDGATVIPLTAETGYRNPFARTYLSGSLSGALQTGYILTELSAAHINSRDRAGALLAPSVSASAGIYYTNVHFDSSLVIKSGFTGKYRGSYVNTGISFIANRVYTVPGTTPSSFALDFFTSGRIADRATVFFLWENITGERYYTIYLYPMPSRSITFGINWEMYN